MAFSDTPKTSSAFDATLDATSEELSNSDPLGSDESCRVELVEGSGPQQSCEARELLSRRLRAAALVLFSAALAFLVWGQLQDKTEFDRPPYLFWSHVALVVVLGASTFQFCVRCPTTRAWLRLHEFIVFGSTAAFLIAIQHHRLQMCCTAGPEDPEAASQILSSTYASVGTWYVLLFTYAIFIPNTLRRAALIVSLMAATPVALVLAARAAHPWVTEVLNTTHVGELVLMMTIGAATAVYGIYTIGSLRQEAFKAKKLGQYRLKELIGAGGMGEVYLAEHQLLKRPCAIKLIHPGKAADPRALARFEREVRITARLSHWNTVEIFDYGRTDDGTFYYVMEYLPGMSLASLVENHGPLPPERVVHLLCQTCDALREAHSVGLIHRDIKPGNIFAAQRGGVFDVAKLLDFGLVKPLSEEESVHLTLDGSIAGSPLYMAPEQAIGKTEPDARSDIYSLGAVAYYLLTGRPPFEGDKPFEILVAHAKDAVVPPSHHLAEIPPDLEQVVIRCLAKDPADRFANAAELKEALLACHAAGQWSEELAAKWWQGTAAEPELAAG